MASHTPAASDLGYMPAFRDSLDDDQVAALVDYLRGQFAPDKPQWSDLRTTIGRIRAGLNFYRGVGVQP